MSDDSDVGDLELLPEPPDADALILRKRRELEELGSEKSKTWAENELRRQLRDLLEKADEREYAELERRKAEEKRRPPAAREQDRPAKVPSGERRVVRRSSGRGRVRSSRHARLRRSGPARSSGVARRRSGGHGRFGSKHSMAARARRSHDTGVLLVLLGLFAILAAGIMLVLVISAV